MNQRRSQPSPFGINALDFPNGYGWLSVVRLAAVAVGLAAVRSVRLGSDLVTCMASVPAHSGEFIGFPATGR